MSFLDIGQGDATLIQSGRDDVLVDTGPPGGRSCSGCARPGVERLDALVITHAQTDHEGMALEVMRASRRGWWSTAAPAGRHTVQRGLRAALAGAPRARRRARRPGDPVRRDARCGSCGRRRPRPASGPTATRTTARWSRSSQSGDFDLFLPADAESNVTAALPLEPVEALKVAHHGSADDGLPGLLERLRPRVAAIEVGRATVRPPDAVHARRAPGGPVTSSAPTATARSGLRVRDGAMTLRERRDARLDSPPCRRFKPAYLIHGDDHGRIAERRAQLRAVAEAESGPGGVELFEGDACTPDASPRRSRR